MDELLNHHAKYWIHPETLEMLTKRIKQRLKDELPEVENMSFDTSSRSFNFEGCSEKTINAAATALLLEMYSFEDLKGFSIRRTSIDELKSEIEEILGMEVLSLP
ncbi:MAG: hypothetical protein GXN98_04625 [Euryarchaeota archaeon]|nr:hypothetical protein [Euryarchaeota archaeon]